MFRNLHPSQGGKYAGFGYTRETPPKSQSQELLDATVSSLATVCIICYIAPHNTHLTKSVVFVRCFDQNKNKNFFSLNFSINVICSILHFM